MQAINDLVKALEAGGYDSAPTSLTQHSALQIENLSPVMENLCISDKHIKLQKLLKTEDAKTMLVQFNRQLSYGKMRRSAQFQNGIGEEQTSKYARVGVPMAFYAQYRRVGLAANMVATFDGVSAEDRSERDAAISLASDMEFDSFRGQDDYSNAGVFDGNPALQAEMPGMRGVFAQIRESDSIATTQDAMFAAYGSNQSVTLGVNGVLTQSYVEDGAVKSAMQHGDADKLMTDPISLSQYNKIAHAKERINLAGSAQEATGANLRTQWTSNGVVTLDSSRFLAGKTQPDEASNALAAASATPTSPVNASSILAAGTYNYYVTAENIRGEGPKSADYSVAVAAGDAGVLTITQVSGAALYNVYRSESGGNSASSKFIGRVKDSGAGTTVFTDLGNRSPGSVTAVLLQSETCSFAQLAPYQKIKLPMNDLSLPECHFSFKCLISKQPRKNVIFENINGQL